jgi:hypothetical protein
VSTYILSRIERHGMAWRRVGGGSRGDEAVCILFAYIQVQRLSTRLGILMFLRVAIPLLWHTFVIGGLWDRETAAALLKAKRGA